MNILLDELQELLQIHNENEHVVVPEATDLAMRYYNSGNLLWIVNWAWTLIVPCLFLLWGLTGNLAAFAKRWGKKWFPSIAIYLVLFVALFQILNFPLDLYSEYIRQHAYGLSQQSFGRWFGNWGKGSLVLLVGAIAFVWIFYWLMKKSPKRWWIYASYANIAIGFFILFIQPIWIAPLFNNFGPMKNKGLEKEILALASRAGIEHGRVFEVDKSRDTNQENAYVTGLGPTQQIVLWDTLIQQGTSRQILFVMGHEMGHYVLHHMWWLMLSFSLFSFALFYFLYRVGGALLHRYKRRFGFTHLSDIASFPLFLLLVSLFSLVTTPLNNYFSRILEHEADRFGLEITQDNQAAGESFLNLIHSGLVNPRPGPIYIFWRCTHPPAAERIDFFNSYCPWTEGKPLKYGHYFNQ